MENAAEVHCGLQPPVYQSPQLEELKREHAALQGYPNARRLIQNEIDKLEAEVATDPEFLEVDTHQNIRLSKKVIIPAEKHPQFNFVGKVLGPGGKSLQELSSRHKSRVFIFGRGSTRDPAKEQELLDSGDPKYAHYADKLHVKIDTIAPPYEAYRRLAEVLSELSFILQPVRDDIVQSQLEQLGHRRGGDASTNGAPRARGMRRGSPRGVNPRMGRARYRPPRAHNGGYASGSYSQGGSGDDYFGNSSGADFSYDSYSGDSYYQDTTGGSDYTDFGASYGGGRGGKMAPPGGRGRGMGGRRPARRAAPY